MSLIRSHHVKLDDHNAYDQRISIDVIKEIATYIINKHASLIVDIETKHANPQLLDKEIIQYLDETNQYQMNRDEVISDVLNYMFGYGILQSYIDDQNITDIDICRYDFIIIKKQGYKEIAPIHFVDELEFTNFCKLIVIRNGGVINEHDCHARVADSRYRLRINVTIAPRNVLGTSMTIRKHRLEAYDLNDLVQQNMLDVKSKVLLKQLMQISSRILIVGKGASGKTTLLRALLKEIPLTERFLICESESELYPENPNFIVQKVQNHNEKTKTDLKQLVRDGLTMSLDGYCVGELIGNEVYEFLKAGYTDHRILGTLHALGVEETFPRMVSMLEDRQINDREKFVSKAVDIIIYMKKFKVMSISEVIHDDDSFNELVSFDIKLETAQRLEGTFMHKSSLKSVLHDELKRRCLC
ncbi:MAG: CpaF family protein [Clostridiales bacterium]|nr:CpaF family protein [Clostridiales bacterium]